jgi:hypothetical protein
MELGLKYAGLTAWSCPSTCFAAPLQVLAGVSGLVHLTDLALSGNQNGPPLHDEALHSCLAHLTNLQILVGGAPVGL